MHNRIERQKAFPLIVVVFVLFFSVVTGTRHINLATANPYLYYKWASPPPDAHPLVVSISSPSNNTAYRTNSITLIFNVSTHEPNEYGLSIDHINYDADWLENSVSVYEPIPQSTYRPPFISNSISLLVPEGEHKIVINATGGGSYAESSTLTSYSFSIATISVINFTVDTTSPRVSIFSIENKTYDATEVQLNFSVNEPFSTCSYVLDGAENVSIGGNTTLHDLSLGSHSLAVFATDFAGNIGASETVTFSVTKPEPSPFPTAPVAAASAVSITVAGVGLLVYFKKRRS